MKCSIGVFRRSQVWDGPPRRLLQMFSWVCLIGLLPALVDSAAAQQDMFALPQNVKALDWTGTTEGKPANSRSIDSPVSRPTIDSASMMSFRFRLSASKVRSTFVCEREVSSRCHRSVTSLLPA